MGTTRAFLVGGLIALSRKDLNARELVTLRVSRNPTKVIAAKPNCEVQTNGAGTVHVKVLNFFVTVQLLEDAPPIL